MRSPRRESFPPDLRNVGGLARAGFIRLEIQGSSRGLGPCQHHMPTTYGHHSVF